MKILCVCQYGHSRSVALARVLHAAGHHAVSIGWSTCGDEAMGVLCRWADVVAVVDHAAVTRIPASATDKCSDFDVGPDRWSNPYHPELFAIMQSLVARRTAQGVIR